MFLVNIEFLTMVQMLYLKKSKGQSVMSDFLIAIVILFIIIALSASIWNRSVSNLRLKEERTEMENLAISITDQLIRNFGIPGDWNKTNVMVIGLAKEDNVLDSEKVTNLINLEKDKTKTLLAVRNYNFIFRLRNISENILVEYGDLPTNAKEVVIVRRIILYKGRPSIMDFGLWE